ncbi:MAG: hypothetical protein WCH39_04805 [Schlesneria sp.]
MATKKQVKVVRGHWPKGVRRNEDNGDWSRTMLAMKTLVEEHWVRGKISYQACAIAVGVTPKTVARWRDGVDRPSVETQELVTRWIADRRAELKSKKN